MKKKILSVTLITLWLGVLLPALPQTTLAAPPAVAASDTADYPTIFVHGLTGAPVEAWAATIDKIKGNRPVYISPQTGAMEIYAADAQALAPHSMPRNSIWNLAITNKVQASPDSMVLRDASVESRSPPVIRIGSGDPLTRNAYSAQLTASCAQPARPRSTSSPTRWAESSSARTSAGWAATRKYIAC